MAFDDYQIEQKKLLSEAFEKFNNTLQTFRDFQQQLEKQILDLRTELSQKNEQLSNILESLSSGLIVTDLTGKVISFNKAASQITSIAPEKAQEKNLNDLCDLEILPAQLNSAGLEKIANDYQKSFHYRQSTGKQVYLETSTTLMRSAKSRENLGIIVNINDVTLLKKLEEEAERKNRLIAMGQIAASVAHEIRNPLGGMELFVSMLKRDLADNPHYIEVITHIQSAMRSMNHIISNILEYTKPRPLTKTKVNLVALVQEFFAFYGPHAKHQNIDLTIDIKDDSASIEGDFELIKQTLQNLYMNAVQSMIDGGKIVISLRTIIEHTPKKIALFDPETIPAEFKIVDLTVADEGEGMSAETKKKVFDPFFTTKPKGTGLGLSIVNQIVRSHKGIMLVDSTLGQGTKISLQFKSAAQH